jgi:hypothetical protein
MVSLGWRIVLLVLLGVGTPAATGVEAQQATPQRLRLSIEPATVGRDETARLRVELLDRAYQPVANDRDRTVEFAEAPAGQGPPGTGVISPPRITIPRGARADTSVTFRAQSVGVVFIRATSEGLVPSQTLVVIAPRPSLRTGPALQFAAYVPSNLTATVQSNAVTLMPHEVQHVPANGVSRAQFQTVLHRVLRAGEQLHVLVRSFPGVHVRYDSTEQLAGVDVVIPEKNAVSRKIELFSTAAGLVHVVARVLPNGRPDTADVEFELPRPARIVVDKEWNTIRVHQKMLLSLRLVDQDRTPLTTLSGTWHVGLSSLTDPTALTFDPDSVALSPERAVGHSTLLLRQRPAANEVRVVAQDLAGVLEAGDLAVTVIGRGMAGILILFAGLGGVVGGVARDVYRRQTDSLLPSWSAGYLHLGLVGNALFSSVFGYMLFQAADLGLVVISKGDSPITDAGTVAFFFGVLGGVGGIVVLDRLLDRVFPGRKTGERRLPTRP